MSPVRDSGDMTRLDQAAMEMQAEAERRKHEGLFSRLFKEHPQNAKVYV